MTSRSIVLAFVSSCKRLTSSASSLLRTGGLLSRTSLIIIAVVAIGVSTWYVIDRQRERATIEDIRKRFESTDQVSKRLGAVRTAAAALRQLEHPNFYLTINAADLDSILKQQSATALPLGQVGGFAKLTINPGAITFGKAHISLAFDFDAQLTDLPASFVGSIVISTTAALDGSKAVFSPLLGRVTLTSLKYKRAVARHIVVDAVSKSLNHMVDLLTGVVQSYSVPLELGVSKAFDLQKILSTVPGVRDISAPTIPLNLSLATGAILLNESGLSFVGSLVDVSPQVYAATVQELKEVAKAGPQIDGGCRDCEMTSRTISLDATPLGSRAAATVPDVKAFAWCVSQKQICETRKALRVTTSQEHQSLGPLQAFVLRQLKSSPNVDDQQLYLLLAPLLAPSMTLGLSAASGTVQQFTEEFAELDAKFTTKRLQVEDEAYLPKGKTLAAVRRDFLSNALLRATRTLHITAQMSIPASREPFDQTIRTDGAPNLNCGKQRPCKSHFEYDGFSPQGCPGTCMQQKCFLRVCTDVPDLGLCARKAACELDREGKRLDYERRKATAQVKFALEKADCERLRVTERVGCEINQQWLNTTQNMDLGNVRGSAQIGLTKGAVAVKSLKVSSNLDTIEVVFDAAAHSQVETSFTFTPLNLGHIACIAQWSGTLSAGVILQETGFVVRAHLSPSTSSNNSGLLYRTEEAQVVIKSVPPLGLALLTQNPQMVLACPIPNALLGAMAGTSPVGLLLAIKLVLSDEIKIKVPAQDLPLTLSIDDSKGPIHFDAKLRVGNQSVFALVEPK